MTAAPPRWIAGVDIGGTNLRVGLVPFEGGRPAAVRQERTRAEHGPADVTARVGAMLRLCVCGSRGCVEAYASGPGIAASAVEGLAEGADSVLGAITDAGNGRVTGRTVCEAVAAGDGYATRILARTARILAAAAANPINLLNPDVIVIAGGVTAAGEHLFGPLGREVRRRAFPSAVNAYRIVPAELPDTAGMIGAARIFKRTVYGHV